MNRKDMIIVAVLINTGLLIVLFISAVKTKRIEKKDVLSSNKMPISQLETPVIQKPHPFQRENQIDQVINEYSVKVAKEKKENKKALPLSVLIPEGKGGKSDHLPKAPLKQTENFRTVTVEKGDVLERIARHNGVSVEEIMRFNQLSNSRLKIGQILKLPSKSTSSKKIAAKEKEVSGKYYTVKGGDNPWTIAKKNGMQVEELLDLNDMDEAKAKRLRPGDKLRIE